MSNICSVPEAQRLWDDYRRGDVYALAGLMENYYADLYHWGMRLCRERETVKDCIQDVFLNLHRIQASVGPVANVRAYLMVVLKSRILRELSRSRGTHCCALPDEYAFSVEFAPDLKMIEEEHAVSQSGKLREMLNELPARQKEIIYLRFYHNLSFEQIAEVMQLGKQSVYNLMQKSLKNIRRNWAAIAIAVFIVM